MHRAYPYMFLNENLRISFNFLYSWIPKFQLAIRLILNWNLLWCFTELLTQGRVTQICVSSLAIIGSDNGLLPGRRQAIIWTNAGILLIWPLGTNLSEIFIEIHTFSTKKMSLKMSSAPVPPLPWTCFFKRKDLQTHQQIDLGPLLLTSNHMLSKLWDEITYPKFQRLYGWSFGMDR